jgi:hypothetical protein
MGYKKGEFEFRLCTYSINELCSGLEFMINGQNRWEIEKIFEPKNEEVKVLFKYKYIK